MSDRRRGDADGTSKVDAIYREFRERLEAGEAVDFETLVSRHTGHENALRLLHLAHEDDGVADESGGDAGGEGMHDLLRDGLAAGSAIRVRSVGAGSLEIDGEIPSARGARRYTVRRQIARGGMGRILEVWDEDLRRALAMKVVRESAADSSAASGPRVSRSLLNRFLNEARLTGQIDHPGVVPVHEIGVDEGGRVFFTMPLVRGRDLESIIRFARQGHEGWTQTRILNVLVRVCETVAYAHSKGIIHRDLKPANIMVGPFGETYVMDWGLAKARGEKDQRNLRIRGAHPADTVDPADTAGVEDAAAGRRAATPGSGLMTLDGTVLGTPAFMPPEQARGQIEELDERSDIYSIGAILYAVLTGSQPFVDAGETPTSRQVLDAVAKGPPRPIQSIRADAPAELVSISEKAMARGKSERYASMDALTEDLRAFLESRVVRAHRTGLAAETRKWVARNRALATSIAAATVLILTGLIAFVFWEEAARRELKLAGEEKDSALAAQAEALRRAQGHRLTAQSSALLADNPALALLLAIEGTRRAPGLTANNALLAALAIQREEQCFRQDGFAAAASLGPDGRYLAIASSDGEARLFEVASGREEMVYIGHDRALTSVEFDPEGKRLVTASWDGTVRVWEVSSGRELMAFTAHGPSLIRAPRFSPDGTNVVTACRDDLTARVFDVETGTHRVLRHRAHVLSASFGPDGRTVITNTPRTILLWDLGNGQKRGRIVAEHYRFSSAALDPTAPAPLRGRIAATCTDRHVRVWEGFEGGESLDIPTAGEMFFVRFSADGQRIVCCGYGDTQVFDTRSGRELARLRGHESRTSFVDFIRDGHFALTASEDGTARIWQISERPPLGSLRPAQTGAIHAFSPDGSKVITAIENWQARIWDVSTASKIVDLRGHTGDVVSASFSPDGSLAVTASFDGSARIWDAASGEIRHTLKEHTGPVTSAVFSPDGSRVLTASHDRTARLWDAATGARLHAFRAHGNWLMSAVFGPGGRRILTSAIDGVRRWDCDSGDSSIWWKSGSVWSAFSDDGKRIVSGTGSMAVVLEADTRRVLATLKGHDGKVTRVVFSPDGQYLVTLSEDDTARAWSANGEEIATLHSPEGSFQHVAFSSTGSHVLTATTGGVVRAWPIDPLAAAVEARPRDLTPEEREQYEIGTREERKTYRDAWIRRRLRESIASHERAARADPDHPEKWLALAAAHARAGAHRDALACHERALRSPGATGKTLETLLKRREGFLPDLVSCASIDAAFASGAEGEQILRDFKAHLANASAKDATAAHLGYVEGRELQLRGEYRGALARFEQVAARDASRPEPVLRIAECLRELGQVEAAEERIRKALLAGVEESDLLWDAWLALNLVDLRRSAARVLASMPGATRAPDVRRDDLAWLLLQLVGPGVVRMNCGGGEYTSSTGEVWGKDRFFTGGHRYFGDERSPARKPFTGEIHGTDDDVLFRTHRRYPDGALQPPGYRIPLPPGEYRVTLLFADLRPPPAPTNWAERVRRLGQVFGIRLEGKRVNLAYTPAHVGRATADRRTYTASVVDGALDLELPRLRSEPWICGIEIERAADAAGEGEPSEPGAVPAK